MCEASRMLLLSTISPSPSGSLSSIRVGLSPLSSINTICTRTSANNSPSTSHKQVSLLLVVASRALRFKSTHLPVFPWAGIPVTHLLSSLLLLVLLLLRLFFVLNEHKLLFVSVGCYQLLLPALKNTQIWPTVRKVGVELIRAAGRPIRQQESF